MIIVASLTPVLFLVFIFLPNISTSPAIEFPNNSDIFRPENPNSTRLKRQAYSNCKNGQKFWRCSNRWCIHFDDLCNGVFNCPDGSDETYAACGDNRCEGDKFRCSYGACLDANVKCDGFYDCADNSDELHPDCRTSTTETHVSTCRSPYNCYSNRNRLPVTPINLLASTTSAPGADLTQKSGCVMPPRPENGEYLIWGKPPTIPPGSITPQFTLLQYSCGKNYTLEGGSAAYCEENNTWSGIPSCLKKCDPIVSLTADLICKDAAGKSLPCEELLPHGTIVTAVCKPQHFRRDGRLRNLVCNQGEWNHPAPRCDPECGFEKSEGVPYVIGGYVVKRGGFPWHVGIYDQHDSNQPPTQICGGTIVANDKIITAAHCFFNVDTQRIEKAKHYWIAAGKLYRDFNHPDDSGISYVQKSKVSQIHVPPFYGGDEQNQQNDFAILILETPLIFSDSVHAACLDLNDYMFDRSQTASGNTGKVSGWGLTAEGGSPSDTLKAVVVPVIDYNSCRKNVPAPFLRYLTLDKLCVGYKNKGISVCNGDSGGGFVVSTKERGVERWYLRGVVSVGPKNEELSFCNSNAYTAFTHVFKLSHWIQDIIGE